MDGPVNLVRYSSEACWPPTVGEHGPRILRTSEIDQHADTYRGKCENGEQDREVCGHAFRGGERRLGGDRADTCQIQDRNCSTYATEVDHIERRDNHTLDNLRGVCSACHAGKSSSEGNRVKARLRALRRRPVERHPGIVTPVPPPLHRNAEVGVPGVAACLGTQK